MAVGRRVVARVTVGKIKHLNGQTIASMTTTVALRDGARLREEGREGAEDEEQDETRVIEGQAMCELPPI